MLRPKGMDAAPASSPPLLRRRLNMTISKGMPANRESIGGVIKPLAMQRMSVVMRRGKGTGSRHDASPLQAATQTSPVHGQPRLTARPAM
ncbi:hypothetical protein BESB_072210 [Besnoitia besnoiti]|uniref:Uncharacterized protein n=1 Tax=Besnoitia besnoiti TaxID=94643 RepID=A0A2A9M819_BESBE|nr:uncharacterized protein BESB_072210 [Besnoitia besnoiti]PFH34069.1 hypothetical protein BESB_072210 [Besnoitia besnoiti]